MKFIPVYVLYPQRQESHNKGTNYTYWSPFEDGSKRAASEEEALTLANNWLKEVPELHSIKITFQKFKTKLPVTIKTILQNPALQMFDELENTLTFLENMKEEK